MKASTAIALVAVGGLALGGVGGLFAGSEINREGAADAAAITEATKAVRDSAKEEFDAMLASLPDSATRAARDDSIRAAGRAQERAAARRAEAARGEFAEEAGDLREAIQRLEVPELLPHVDAMERSFDLALAAKDDEKAEAVATEVSIADRLRGDVRDRDGVIAQSLVTMRADSVAYAALEDDKDFWVNEAERIAGGNVKIPFIGRIHVRAGLQIGLCVTREGRVDGCVSAGLQISP